MDKTAEACDLLLHTNCEMMNVTIKCDGYSSYSRNDIQHAIMDTVRQGIMR